ncbi:indole-3-glycerol phosphate synthase [Nocardiopsis arvandica]|uniref:indole-3-glycerol-phosphate synthase n=1 Tax=Nocardiopsis sinuspersici TaxID=501010 RepID=A0A7Y9XJK7_9ACTN|nr:indole-3-glycerol-phosphate synthase [Nocardiopsis sinuspersici]NYH55670.1 indole-3-glycerol phosphate synthase [Nocardiopsis sinuspersici]
MTSRFVEALVGADLPVVMEIKRRAPDGSELLRGRTVAQVVTAYEEAGAPCLSVVTGRWFGGSEALLAEVATLTALPVLRKDFVTSGRGLARSRDLGASAVLLTSTLLAHSTLCRLVDRALDLGLTPFVEVATEAEALRVPRAGECVVAVNNKDIRARERGAAELERSRELLTAVRLGGTPCPVSASGIDHPVDAAELLASGYAGLLVGTGLLGRARPRDWCQEFDRHRAAVTRRPCRRVFGPDTGYGEPGPSTRRDPRSSHDDSDHRSHGKGGTSRGGRGPAVRGEGTGPDPCSWERTTARRA